MCQSGRVVGWEWRRGALIDSRVACLCLAGGEGGGGARSSLFKWRVGVWRAGRDGGGARFGWRFVLMGGEWWESALNDMLVACWAGVGRGGESAYRYDGCAFVCLAGAEGGKGWGEGRAH